MVAVYILRMAAYRVPHTKMTIPKKSWYTFMTKTTAIAIGGGFINVPKRVRLAVVEIEVRCGLSRGSCLSVVVEDPFRLA